MNYGRLRLLRYETTATATAIAKKTLTRDPERAVHGYKARRIIEIACAERAETEPATATTPIPHETSCTRQGR